MGDYTTITTYVKTQLETVADIGAVHAYERLAANWDEFLSRYRTTVGGTAQVRGWFITREAVRPLGTAPFGSVHRQHVIVVRGVLGVDDSANTETIFQELIDLVLDKLDAIKDAGAASVIDYSFGDSEARIIEPRVYGGVLCHYCEISLPVERVKALTYA